MTNVPSTDPRRPTELTMYRQPDRNVSTRTAPQVPAGQCGDEGAWMLTHLQEDDRAHRAGPNYRSDAPGHRGCSGRAQLLCLAPATRCHELPNEDRCSMASPPRMDRLASRAVTQLVVEPRPVVAGAILMVNPAGSSPAAELLQEALREYVELIDATLADEQTAAKDLLPDDRRWLDACRQCTQSIELFPDLLTDLGAEAPSPPPRTQTSGEVHGESVL